MKLTIAHIMLLLMPSSVVMAQQRLVVVNVESKVPIRDVRVCTDNGREVRTSWDGSVAVPDSFLRIDFLHPDFERRYVLKSELHGDTIFLIPNTNALHEVVIYGERRFDKRMAQITPADRARQNAQGGTSRHQSPRTACPDIRPHLAQESRGPRPTEKGTEGSAQEGRGVPAQMGLAETGEQA